MHSKNAYLRSQVILINCILAHTKDKITEEKKMD